MDVCVGSRWIWGWVADGRGGLAEGQAEDMSPPGLGYQLVSSADSEPRVTWSGAGRGAREGGWAPRRPWRPFLPSPGSPPRPASRQVGAGPRAHGRHAGTLFSSWPLTCDLKGWFQPG